MRITSAIICLVISPAQEKTENVREVFKMMAQIAAVAIFAIMFGLIVLDKFERHIVTLSCGAAMLILVFGILMAVINAISDYARKRKEEKEKKQIALIESAEAQQRISEAFGGASEKDGVTEVNGDVKTESDVELKNATEGGND